MKFNDITTIEGFRAFVGNSIATVEFIKKDGSIRKLNFRLGVSKYVKNTAPESTAKRKETNDKHLQIGVYEMVGTSTDIAEKNYRTISIAPDRLISLTSKGKKLVNEVLTIGDFDLGEDKELIIKTKSKKV